MPIELRSDRLKVFVAIVDAGGFSRAARALEMTQSSVSQALSALENDVGSTLLVRQRPAPVLTEAGSVLLAHARQVGVALERAGQALLDLRDVATGTLRVGASDTLATYVLPDVFAAFRNAYPRVALTLDNRPSPTIARKVAARELDVGVVSLPLPDERATAMLTQVPLREQTDVAIVAEGHDLATKGKARIVDLARYPLLLLDQTTGLRQWLDRQFHEVGETPRIAMQMSSVEVLKRLVKLGFGISVVPSLALSPNDGVVAVPLVGVRGRRQVGAIIAPSPRRISSAFLEMARVTLSGQRRQYSRPA